jgi:mono/diheme cytochrome c family protein/cytochrome c553
VPLRRPVRVPTISRVFARSGVGRGILAAVLVILAGAGCGSSEAPATGKTTAARPAIKLDGPVPVAALARGRTLFQAAADPAGCGFCHSLGAAATDSPIAPSLDAEMTEPDLKSLTDTQLSQRVLGWIHKAQCPNPADATRCMPADIYTGEDAATVAVFVAVCGRRPTAAGCQPVAGGLRGKARRGEHLFQWRGCTGCHFSNGGPSSGPALKGVAGSRVALANGKTAVADDAYLVESLTAPDAQIVAGYQSGVMSSRVLPQNLTHAEIDALVAYIKTLK